MMMGENKRQRIGRRELAALLERVSERDKAILQALCDYHYLQTGHIQRLYYRRTISRLAALRATNRCLLRLEQWGLITSLKRRIGGMRAGSSAYVWTLAPAGFRLLDALNRGGDENVRKNPVRKRVSEPSFAFLQHTLAIAEVSIQLTELAFAAKVGLAQRQVEPQCWRSYSGFGKAAATLRPDLYVVTLSGEYEDHWFIEVDLDSESPCVVVRKCQQYLSYRQSGIEQSATGVFPRVVWIVPDAQRKASLLLHINDSLLDAAGLFCVITLDELEPLVLVGASDA